MTKRLDDAEGRERLLDGRAHAERAKGMLHVVVRLLGVHVRFEITLLETTEGGTRS